MPKAFSPSNVSLAVRSLLLQRKGRSSDTMPREKNVSDEPRPELVWWVVELGFRRTLPKTRSNRALGSSLTPLRRPACVYSLSRFDPSGARLERSWKLHSAFRALLCLRQPPRATSEDALSSVFCGRVRNDASAADRSIRDADRCLLPYSRRDARSGALSLPLLPTEGPSRWIPSREWSHLPAPNSEFVSRQRAARTRACAACVFLSHGARRSALGARRSALGDLAEAGLRVAVRQQEAAAAFFGPPLSALLRNTLACTPESISRYPAAYLATCRGTRRLSAAIERCYQSDLANAK